MHNLDKLDISTIICVGRAGGGLLQSLLDNHEQILMIPMELKFFQMWNRFNCDNIRDPRAMADIWINYEKNTKTKNWNTY